MCAEILERSEGRALVEVHDRRGNRHLVEVGLPDGEIGRHGQDAYPRDPGRRTDEQERIMYEVDTRAQYEVHVQTDHDLFGAGWDPRELERGLDALEAMSEERMADQFRDYYDALREPQRLRREYGIVGDEVAFDGDPRVTLVHKGFCVADGEVSEVLDGVYFYYSAEGTEEARTAGTAGDCESGTLVTLLSPPFESVDDEFSVPEDLRTFLLNNLSCQIRDVYRNMGESPPDRYDVDGFGKPRIPSHEAGASVE